MSEVIYLNTPDAEWHRDLDELEREIAQTSAFSGEKGHLLHLLMETAKNKNLSEGVRHRACSIVWTHSQVRQFLSSQLVSCHESDSEQTWWSPDAIKNWAVR